MADRNFSHRTLAQKLGLNPGDKITVINPPENYLNLLGFDVSVSHTLTTDSQFIHYFAKSKSQLEKDFPNLKKYLSKDGMLWISNQKGDAEFDQQDVQKIGLENGLVDTKIASINDEWSAMKFVYRRADR